jgi:hypothetical protein
MDAGQVLFFVPFFAQSQQDRGFKANEGMVLGSPSFG